MTRPRFRRHEIVRMVTSAKNEAYGVVGFEGIVDDVDKRPDGSWYYDVTIPRRRHRGYTMEEHEIEGTGRIAPPEPEVPRVSMKVQVDPDSGAGTLLDEAGDEIEAIDDEAEGLPLFTVTAVIAPDADEDDDDEHGVVVAKGRRPDGSWRYVVLLWDERMVEAHDRHELDPTVWIERGTFLDRGRPAGLDEVERAERAGGVELVAAWHAPRPAFGYDQGVRVLDRPHTEAVAGRVGTVRAEDLGDDLRWRYLVLFDDDPAADCRSATVDEADLEATGRYGEGYNPPPDWLALP